MPWAWPCCGEEEPKRPARPKIDRSMIGQPTNFQHTGHIGSGDMGSLGSQLPTVELQMKGKGGHVDAGEGAVPNASSPASNAVEIVAVKEDEKTSL